MQKVVIAGGAESSVTPLGIAGFASMHALSTRNDDPQRASRPFDIDRDGFVMGEGSAMLILEATNLLKHAVLVFTVRLPVTDSVQTHFMSLLLLPKGQPEQ